MAKPGVAGCSCTSIAFAMSSALATATTLATAVTRAVFLIIATCLIDQIGHIFYPATNSAA